MTTAKPAAITRLPEDVLGSIALYLTGTDAINFGLVCKAWSRAAQPAIWGSMTIELPRHYGEMPFAMDPTRHTGLEVFKLSVVDPRVRLAQATRLREKCEAVLAALYARPARRELVHDLAIDYRAGNFALPILLAVRQTLCSMHIQLVRGQPDLDPDDPEDQDLYDDDGYNPDRLILPGMNIWDTMESLFTSRARFEALQTLYLEIDDSFTEGSLVSLLGVCPSLHDVTLDIKKGSNPCLYDGPCAPNKITRLTIMCEVKSDKTLPLAVSQLVEACPNLRILSVGHEFGYKVHHDWYESIYDGPYPDYEVRDDNFFEALANLDELDTLRWCARPYGCFAEWAKEVDIDPLEILWDMRFQMPVGSYLSLQFGSFESFVPALLYLESLSFEAESTSPLWPLRPEPSDRSITTIPEATIRCFERAPMLRLINVHDMSLPAEVIAIERLSITTVRRQGSDEPSLYITRHNCIRSGYVAEQQVATLRHPRTHTATSFCGKPVEQKVLRRMAKIHGVDMLEGRDVEVGEEAWAELEKYYAAIVEKTGEEGEK